MKLSFEVDQIACVADALDLGLFWTKWGSEVSEETWGTFCILYGQGKYVLKGNF